MVLLNSFQAIDPRPLILALIHQAIQEQLASYYQRRQVLEEDNVRIKKARHQLDESLA